MSNQRDDEEPFLSRWSRRKRDAVRQPGTEPGTEPEHVPAVAPDAPGSVEADANAAPSSEEPLDLAKLPRVEELTVETDITAFLDHRVPAALRNAALGRMWTLDPTIRDFIEVAENQWNWNVPGGAPFYEIMEPGSEIGTLVADASSAISRALGVPQVEPAEQTGEQQAEQKNVIDSTKEFPPDSERLAGENNAAPHHAAIASNLAEPQAELASIEKVTSAVSVTNDVAPQHAAAPAIPGDPADRRRHGSALPA